MLELMTAIAEKDELIRSLQAEVERLTAILQQIKITEDSYDTEQTVLGEIYLLAEDGLNENNTDA